MKGNYLIAVDLEGIHGVVGEPYQGLYKGSAEHALAVENATKELQVIVKALFDQGAEIVAVWDNHGTGVNLDFSRLDSRVVHVYNTDTTPFSRFAFQKEIPFDGVLYIGYHAKAGTLNGVLNHTYSSKTIQYFKINGCQVGEFEVDSYIAAEKGIPALLIASDHVCVQQVQAFAPHVLGVVTKYGTGRNSAVFIDEAAVLEELYRSVCAAVQTHPQPIRLQFPCDVEARFTRMEDAEKVLQRQQAAELPTVYGEDTHTITATVTDMAQFETFMWRK